MNRWYVMLMAALCLLATAAFAQRAEEGGKERPAPQQVTLEGTIKAVRVPEKGIEPVVFILREVDGVRIRTAPAAFLAKIGLTLKEGLAVKVEGFKGDGKEPVVIARLIIVDGKTYELRGKNGRQLWGEISGLPEITAEGIVRDLVFPAPTAQPAEGQKPAPNMVTFILANEKNGPQRVNLGPAQMMRELGLTLQNGARVNVTGWVNTFKQNDRTVTLIIARTITVDGKTYILRDADGKRIVKKTDRPEGKREGAK